MLCHRESCRYLSTNNEFAAKAAGLIFNRIIDVIENDGKKTSITGEKIKV